jgi:hypothetical protein
MTVEDSTGSASRRQVEVKKTMKQKKPTNADSGRASPTKPTAQRSAMPDVAAAAALNFLKETKGALTWTTQEFARGVGINVPVAGAALAVLQMQGYIKPGARRDEWMTTLDGDAVSGATAPRFSGDTVQQALADLRARIAAVNKDAKAEFRITKAVATGDFLVDRARVQAADVGIELARRKVAKAPKRISKAEERAFLRALRGGKQMIRLVTFEPWMMEREHLRLM